MIDGNRLGTAGDRYLGTPYTQMDCQAFVEQCLRVCGLDINLTGSNAWFREVRRNGEILTPEECTKKYGKVPTGAFLFIWANDGKEPEKYKQDGLGNASHIGIVTNQTAEQMMAEVLATIQDPEERASFVKKVSHGNGAIHSSSTRKCVATSTFDGKTIRNGGWNRVGLWNRVDYGTEEEPVDPFEPVIDPGMPTLRRGDKGEYVTLLQTRLIQMGYSLPKWGADGDFGAETLAAVIQFQQDWNRQHPTDPMPVDGVVGARTWDAILGGTATTYTVTISGVSFSVADEIVRKYGGTMTAEGVG